MHQGDMLELVRESDNDHDPCVIALHFNNHNENNLPDYLKTDPVTKALDEGAVRLGEYLGNDGYVAANINRLAELSPPIKQFSEILDKQGRRFFEAYFKK
jgi:hypothetical protein